jgi:hypothetical protein
MVIGRLAAPPARDEVDPEYFLHITRNNDAGQRSRNLLVEWELELITIRDGITALPSSPVIRTSRFPIDFRAHSHQHLAVGSGGSRHGVVHSIGVYRNRRTRVGSETYDGAEGAAKLLPGRGSY